MGNPTSIFIHSAIWAGPDLSRTWLSWCGKPSLLGAQWICGSRSNGHSDGLDMTIGGESYYSWMGNILVGFGSGSDLSFWIILLLWTFWTLALNVLVDLWRSCRKAVSNRGLRRKQSLHVAASPSAPVTPHGLPPKAQCAVGKDWWPRFVNWATRSRPQNFEVLLHQF